MQEVGRAADEVGVFLDAAALQGGGGLGGVGQEFVKFDGDVFPLADADGELNARRRFGGRAADVSAQGEVLAGVGRGGDGGYRGGVAHHGDVLLLARLGQDVEGGDVLARVDVRGDFLGVGVGGCRACHAVLYADAAVGLLQGDGDGVVPPQGAGGVDEGDFADGEVQGDVGAGGAVPRVVAHVGDAHGCARGGCRPDVLQVGGGVVGVALVGPEEELVAAGLVEGEGGALSGGDVLHRARRAVFYHLHQVAGGHLLRADGGACHGFGQVEGEGDGAWLVGGQGFALVVLAGGQQGDAAYQEAYKVNLP